VVIRCSFCEAWRPHEMVESIWFNVIKRSSAKTRARKMRLRFNEALHYGNENWRRVAVNLF
jgi:hypothetical protein